MDYKNTRQGDDLFFLLDGYAKDPMGGSTPLAEDVKNNLLGKLSNIPHAFSVLCYVGEKPAGLINCFVVFSTFQCKPLVNIHDVVVADNFRGQGVSQKMLMEVERIAKEKDCCKLTLEVLSGNMIAKNAYKKFGFSDYELDPVMGNALFWQKPL